MVLANEVVARGKLRTFSKRCHKICFANVHWFASGEGEGEILCGNEWEMKEKWGVVVVRQVGGGIFVVELENVR